jgi:hypothetical protein
MGGGTEGKGGEMREGDKKPLTPQPVDQEEEVYVGHRAVCRELMDKR